MKFIHTNEKITDELITESRPLYFAGLDLGQAQDFSAIAVLERSGAGRNSYTFHCRYLKRWALRTPYPAVVADTVKMMNSAETQNGNGYPTLAVDATGVGAPVIDLFKGERMKATLRPIQIVGGANVSEENGMFRVPKRDLVSNAQVALQNKTLKISPKLPEAETLIRELQNFKAKISDSGHDSYGAAADWREGNNDDLVLALAIALWAAIRFGSTGIFL